MVKMLIHTWYWAVESGHYKVGYLLARLITKLS